MTTRDAIARRAEAEWEECGICRERYTTCLCCPGACGRQTEDGHWCAECARAEWGRRQAIPLAEEGR